LGAELVTERPSTGSGSAGYTLDELARRVGMSPRNVRAHQARRLLPPPDRQGRVALYDDTHVRRLETILALQRQGFNLASIEAMLGARAVDQPSEPATALLHRLMTERPALAHALSRHGVLGRGDDGTLRPLRPRALRSALDLHRTRVGAMASLQVLSDALDAVRPMAGDLVDAMTARIVALAPDAAGGGDRTWEEQDQDATVLTQAMVGMLTEAFRVAVERQAEATVLDLLGRRLNAGKSLAEAR
jgi:DNA-binding transcriptional MerR regulator